MVTQLTSFIGRTQELAEIATLLADPICRLLTLVGPGGIGKTRVAIKAMQTLGFPHGVHFVPLQPVADAALLPIAIANALGIQFFGADEPRVQLVKYLQERQTLLILDNFEHLLDGIDFIIELLTAPGVKLLVTSRAALNIQAEWRYAVSGLDFPNDAHEVENFDAVKLFTERAHRLRHDFSLDEQRTHVIRICQLTEGMPLALELAAGWLKVLSCAEIANEMQRGLDFLAANSRDVPERHRSMAAAFAQSWNLLTDDEQKIFRRMSVFRGGFTREAAEKVTGVTLQILANLVDKSFLRVDGTGRYDLQELLRQYGKAKLEAADEVNLTRDAQSTYYLNFLAQRAQTIHTPQMVEILNEIEADFDNIRIAWERAVATRNHQAISRAIEPLTWYCDRRSRLIEHEQLYALAQEQFTPQPDEQPLLVWGQLMARRAIMIMQYDPSNEQVVLSTSFFRKALDIARLHNHPFEIAYATIRFGHFLSGLGDPNALPYLEQSLSSFQETNNQFYISECLAHIGSHYCNVNNLDNYFLFLNRSAELKLQAGDQNGAAWILWSMSRKHYDQCHYDEADHTIRHALKIFQDVGNPLGIGEATQQLAIRSFLKGDLEEALRLAEETLKIVSPLSYISALMAEEIIASIGCIADDAYSQSQHYPADARIGRHKYLNSLELIVPCGLGHYEQAQQRLSSVLAGGEGKLTASIKVYVLTIAAIILANQDKQEHALEIFSLLFGQPIELVGWVKRWGLVSRLLARLQADLSDQIYGNAWEHGKNLDLEVTFAEIMAEFNGENIASPTPNSALLSLLTPRELDVLRLVTQGHSNRQIADELVIANTTVRGYVHIICQKLGAQNRTHAIVRARELHLL